MTTTLSRRAFLDVTFATMLAMNFGLGSALAQDAGSNDQTAIDILLEPDATMLRHAEAKYARLLKAFPKDFGGDAAPRPRITLAQRFVHSADLEKVYAAAGRALAKARLADMRLEAVRFDYLADKEIGLAGIVVEPTPELLKLQADIIAAVAPYTVETGGSAAFVTTADAPDIPPALIDYVSSFVPKASGAHYTPHVATGLATRADLDQMLAKPFKPFAFFPAGAAVYQLGPFGTAAKKLTQLDVKN